MSDEEREMLHLDSRRASWDRTAADFLPKATLYYREDKCKKIVKSIKRGISLPMRDRAVEALGVEKGLQESNYFLSKFAWSGENLHYTVPLIPHSAATCLRL